MPCVHFSPPFGNPSSAHYPASAPAPPSSTRRASVARLLNCSSKEIVFTSGGTESRQPRTRPACCKPFLDKHQPAHLITTEIEHHAVLYAAQALHRRGIEVTYLAPTPDGLIDPAAFEAALRPTTELVSIMLANNETGAIQPIGKLARIAKAYNPAILVHTDAVQAAGKLPIDLSGEFKNVDLLSISGHKMYAPQGTGVLFVRSGIHIAPLFHGGPHERQRRAGTENVPGIVALGRAAEMAVDWLNSKLETHDSQLETQPQSVGALQALRDRLETGLLATIPNAHLNGSSAHRVPNTTSLRFDGVDAESLLIALDMQGIAASFGAACQSGATEPSHVLLAMGLTAAEARASLRLSLTRLTTVEEIDRALDIIPAAVARLRSLA